MPRLRVLAGSSTSMVPITSLVNTGRPYPIVSDEFEGEMIVYIKCFNAEAGKPCEQGDDYFDREDRQGVTWSIQVQGRFLNPYSADDILFGNTFDRPLKLPWGSSAALRFMNYVDPTLSHDLSSSTKPWALSPLVSTMPYFAHTRLASSRSSSPDSSTSSLSLDEVHGLESTPPPFPPLDNTSVQDDTSQLCYALCPDYIQSNSSSSSSSSSLSSDSSASSRSSKSSLSLKKVSAKLGNKHSEEKKLRRREANKMKQIAALQNLQTAAQRRSYFSHVENRHAVVFGPQDVITTDFCYGFLEFSPTLSLRLPGGMGWDLTRYWDGQPVRFVCCKRPDDTQTGRDEDSDPWGKVFWCVAIEPCDDSDDEEVRF